MSWIHHIPRLSLVFLAGDQRAAVRGPLFSLVAGCTGTFEPQDPEQTTCQCDLTGQCTGPCHRSTQVSKPGRIQDHGKSVRFPSVQFGFPVFQLGNTRNLGRLRRIQLLSNLLFCETLKAPPEVFIRNPGDHVVWRIL